MKDIKSIPIFSKLDDKNIEALKQISHFKSYKSDEIVFYEGDLPKYLYILIHGVLRLYKTDNKGQEFYIHQFTPIAIIGELANFENIPFPASARFITKGIILKVEFQKLKEDFFCNPQVNMEIIRSLTNKIKILSRVIHKEMILTSEAKVARFIVHHKDLFATLKNTQIASVLNIAPETLSRILTKFKKLNLISINKYHNVTILDEAILTSLFE